MRSGSVGTRRTGVRKIPWVVLFAALLVAAVTGSVTPASAEDGHTSFTVVIENVSNDGTLTTSSGSVAVPLSPGAYLVHPAGRNALLDPRDQATPALEALAEDGDPSGFPSQVPGAQVFNTPDGASGPGPLLPGQTYSFSIEAKPGEQLSLATMFVQSNDWFYSTLSDEQGIELFDAAGAPISGDVSDQLKLWESKTELDEAPGTGANQAPRQSAPNTGVSETGQVISLNSLGKRPPLTGPVMKVTITPADAPSDGEEPDDGEEPTDGEEPGDGEEPTDGGARPGEPFDAGDGTEIGRSSTLNGLNGLNVGPDGNVYIASVAGNEITVHDPETGEILDRIGPERGVFGPDDVFITPDGTIYWTEILAGNVGMVKPDGTFKTQFVGPGVNPITMSDDGRLFVARVFLGDGLYELDPELETDPVALIPDLVSLNGMDFGPDGLLYGPLFFFGEIVRIDVDAATPTPETVASGLQVPSAVKFNSAGELHASEIAGGRILKVDAGTGDVEVVAQIEGTIDNLAFDADDRLFFAAGADNQIVRVTPPGQIDVLDEITLTNPGGLAVGPDGTVWVADFFGMRGYADGPDPVVSFYDRFPAPGTGFNSAGTVWVDGDNLVTSALFGNNVQVINPATGEILEDFRNLTVPTNAIVHDGRLVASQLGEGPGDANVVDARTGEVLLEGLVLPTGLTSDGTTMYVSDWATGTITALGDSGPTVIASGLTGPEGMVVDGNRILVLEEGLDQLSAVDIATGTVTPVVTGLDIGATPVPAFTPFGIVSGVTVGPDGAIYVSQDGELNSVLKFAGDQPDESGGFIDALEADGRFTTLLNALESSFLEPPPAGEQFTLFAPTDDAFAVLPDGALEGLLADPGLLTDVLLYHLAEGAVSAETLATMTGVPTLRGPSISVDASGGSVVLNGSANVIEADLDTNEGIIHVIDEVLQAPEGVGLLVADFARGSTEVPDPGDLESLSIAFIEVLASADGGFQFCFNSGTTIQDPTVAHIHRGAAGEAGPVVVDTGFNEDTWTADPANPLAQGSSGCADVDADLGAEILGSPGDFYFNLHSSTFPAGANREQLFDGGGLSEFPRAYTAAPLLGANEVPGPGDPDSGRGFTDLSLPVTANGDLCYRSTVFRVGEITAGHIHAGAAGAAGDVLIDLEIGSTWPVLSHPSGQGWVLEGCVPAGEDALTAIAADPAGHYVNLHNEEFPAGAVRAQLVEGVGETLIFAELQASEGAQGGGFAAMAFFPDQELLCWDTPLGGPLTPVGMFIQGPQQVTLDVNTFPILPVPADPNVDFTSFGCQTVEAATLNAIIADPGAHTFVVDTVEQASALTGSLFDPTAPPPPPGGDDAINLQILAINDFHGNIATTSGAFGGVGRADFLATNMAAAEAEADHSISVSAGDLIGASPLISALFHDEPTIEAMNLIGLDINGVGNHEFDEGPDELLRLAHGGSHPIDGDLDGDGFEGADFEFLAANVVDDETGETIFDAYTVKEYEGVEVAFIGMTLEGTPSIVTPAGVAGLTFNDEVETVNNLIPEIRERGIEAIVVLLHEGGIASEGGGDGDGCGTLSGPLNDIVLGLDDAVDLVIGGHNNQRFACLDVGGKAVTMAYHSGRMFTDIDTTLDPATGDMTVVSIDNKENFQDGVTPDATVTALIDRYDALSAPLANRVIGSITEDITEDNTDAGESALGDVIADAQLAATSSAETGAAVVAFMNPGGIRDDFLTADVEGGEAPGEVTFGEAFSVQPFGNSLVTMTLTGTQIHTLLTQQWVGQEEGNPRILQVSEGFSYTWDADAADEDRVDPATIMIDGVVVDPAGSYRVTVNSFLSDGGDNFAVLAEGTDRLGGEVDLDALVAYFDANTPVAPGPQDRITRIGGPG